MTPKGYVYQRMTHLNPTFAELGVRDEIVRALAEDGIEHPFAIQELTLPLALAGDDLIGQARTGMGKTFAFGVPLLQAHHHRHRAPAERHPASARRGAPPANCACRSSGDLAAAAKYLTAGDRKLTVTSIYGGARLRAADRGAAQAASTSSSARRAGCSTSPSRATCSSAGVAVLVLDEADEMLDLGFLPDIERILRQIPDDRQAMLFSATMPDPIITLARTLHEPADAHPGREVAAILGRARPPPSSSSTAPTRWTRSNWSAGCCRPRGRGATMIFTRTKRTAQKVVRRARPSAGFKVGAVHGDLGSGRPREGAQGVPYRRHRRAGGHRRRAPAASTSTTSPTSSTTRCPEDEQAYVHRIGRTGRAGKTGVGDHPRRLGRAGSLGNDRQGAGPGLPRLRPRPTPAHRISTRSWTSRRTPTGTVGPEPRKLSQASCARRRGQQSRDREAARPQPPPATAGRVARPWRQAGSAIIPEATPRQAHAAENDADRRRR